MINDRRISKILYGGDYNPEQWPEEIWEEDMRLLKKAGIDIVTLNIFSWAALQPSEEVYDFERLDRIMELVRKNGMKVCMATSTAAHPAWMAKRHPDVLRVDFHGRKRKFGGRHNSCPNSPTFRKYSPMLARKIAERYQAFDNIVGWHVSNEYGGACYCENCEKAFREWLKQKYGSLERLNKAWNTAFWSHTFYDFDEIVAPNLLTEHFSENRTEFQGISLDYQRFMSDSILQNYIDEANEIHAVIKDARITTNFMLFFKGLDYQKWAKHLDFISWDSYPAPDTPYAYTAMCHDLMRGMKHGQPFVLMEQTPGVVNWQSYCSLKRPGVMRLYSWQAVAHGADAVMFFQMRRSIGASEKYHGAVIEHVGTEDTRVFREVAELGKELKALGDATLGAVTSSRIALIFDWDNWWAAEYSSGPTADMDYQKHLFLYYRALREQNYSVDVIPADEDFSKYRFVIAPLLYMTKGDLAHRIQAYVEKGGHFLTTCFSGYVDENDLVITGGYPGDLKEVLGIWVEETDVYPEGKSNHFSCQGKSWPAEFLCDIIHLRGAEAIAFYEDDFYAGTPALTEHSFGEGKAWYFGTRPSLDFLKGFFREKLSELGISPVLDTPEDVEAAERSNEHGNFLFVMNHGTNEKSFVMPGERTDLLSGKTYMAGEETTLAAKQVLILTLPS